MSQPVEVVFGDVIGPDTVWVVPDRETNSNKNTTKVVNFETNLTEVCYEKVKSPGTGMVVGVRYQKRVVRGRIEELCGDQGIMFLIDWGVTVQRKIMDLLLIPVTVKAPRNSLAQRLRLCEGGKVWSGSLLQDLVTECGRGILSYPEISSNGQFVSGRLTVDVNSSFKLKTKYGDQWIGKNHSRLCVNDVLVMKYTETMDATKARMDKKIEMGSMALAIPCLQNLKTEREISSQQNEKISKEEYSPSKFVMTSRETSMSRSESIRPDLLDDKSDVADVSSTSIPDLDMSSEVTALLCGAPPSLGGNLVTTQLEGERLELEDNGEHTRKEGRWPSAELERLVIHTPKGSRCVRTEYKICSTWPDSLLSYLQDCGLQCSSPLQSVLWPALSRLQSVVGVADAGQGKTVGWILPIIGHLAYRDTQTQPPGPGPMLVVLCPGVQTASHITGTLQEVAVGARLDLNIVQDTAGTRDVDPTQFLNGVDVLVTTPPRLSRRLKEKPQLTGMERCCHLVMEETNTLLEKWENQVMELLLHWRQARGRWDQLVVLANRWNHVMDKFCTNSLKDMASPVLVVASMIEAVVYGKLKVVPTFIESVDDKVKKLLSVVRKHNGCGRVVICCRDQIVAKHVARVISCYRRPVILDEERDIADLTELVTRWIQSPSCPLVVTDLALAVLPVSLTLDQGPPVTLLHWDLPCNSKKTFGHRLGLVRNGVRNIFQPETCVMETKVRLLLEPEDGPALSTIIPWLERCGANIEGDLAVFYEGVTRARERKMTICSLLGQFGVCSEQRFGRCHDRHIAQESDLPREQNRHEILTFKILRVETPIKYWVRLVHNQESERRYQKLVLSMAKHYCRAEARVGVKSLERGQLVAVLGHDGTVKRGRVVQLVYRMELDTHNLEKIEVFTVDDGVLEVVKPEEVYCLPENLDATFFPPLALAVIVSSLVPPDMDKDWGSSATMFVSSHLLGNKPEEEVVCRGKVLLYLNSIVWLGQCQLMVRQPAIGKFVCQFETVRELLSSGAAVPNQEHMKSLTILCEQAGGTLHCQGEVADELEDEQPEQYKTAFLPMKETVSVYMSECLSPTHFYLHKILHMSSLLSLEKDLTRWAVENGYPQYSYKPEVGQVVMVKLEDDDDWIRGRVVAKLGAKNIESELESEPMVEERVRVFCLDSGETIEVGSGRIGFCPQHLVHRLPFQAVRCTLWGWGEGEEREEGEQEGDALFHLTRDQKTDAALPLECRLVNRGEQCVVRLHNGVGDLATLLRKGNMARRLEGAEESEVFWSSGDSHGEDQEWDLPNGLPDNVLDMKQTMEVAKQSCSELIKESNYEQEEIISLHTPSLNPVNNSTTTTTKTFPLALTTRPPSLPPLQLIKGRAIYSEVVPESILWSQDHISINLQVNISSKTELTQDQVYIRLHNKLLEIQVLEVDIGGRESYTLHRTPPLTLWGELICSKTVVKVRGLGLSMTLIKARTAFWPQLVMEKFRWIRANLDRIGSSGSQSEEDERGKEKPRQGFLEPYLVRGEGKKNYHPLTGEEVLPEHAFLTEGSDSEIEELDFIHNKPVQPPL